MRNPFTSAKSAALTALERAAHIDAELTALVKGATSAEDTAALRNCLTKRREAHSEVAAAIRYLDQRASYGAKNWLRAAIKRNACQEMAQRMTHWVPRAGISTMLPVNGTDMDVVNIADETAIRARITDCLEWLWPRLLEKYQIAATTMPAGLVDAIWELRFKSASMGQLRGNMLRIGEDPRNGHNDAQCAF